MRDEEGESRMVYKATWKNDRLEGIVVQTDEFDGNVLVIEYKDGREFGKGTHYRNDGGVTNLLTNND